MDGAKRLTDEQAKELLPLIRAKVRKFIGDDRRDQEDRRDLVQEAYVRLLQRLSTFDPERGSLGDLAATIVDSVLVDHVRYQHAAKRDRRRERLSLSTSIRGSTGDRSELGATVSTDDRDSAFGRHRRDEHEIVDLLLDVSEMLRRMKPGHRRLCERLKTDTVQEAADDEGIARGTGYRRLRAIQRRLRNNALRKYLE